MAPGRKCTYFGCNNTSSEFSMFRFPIKDKSRLKLWLQNAGNMNLSHLTEDELYNRYICEVHFEHCDIKKTTAFRPVLEKTAVPICAISPEHLKVETPVKESSNKSKLQSGEGNINNSGPGTTDTIENLLCRGPMGPLGSQWVNKPTDPEYNFSMPRKTKDLCLSESPQKTILKLKESMTYYVKKIKSNNITIKRMKNKISGKKFIDIDNFEFKSENAKIFTKMQLRKRQIKWKTSEKKFCLSLYYKSPSMYRHLIKIGLILAPLSTIKRWKQRNSSFPDVPNLF
ncbi:uncharacterized protein LOC123695289 [Colias croceus]|uniref:uncharacterized protein LOC123695289 n=1 Tax=Colias crocea TaxID=72248 RepID=UPI001E27A81D|nr:uncharacterized protein LOC123695289 [Colias croceus]